MCVPYSEYFIDVLVWFGFICHHQLTFILYGHKKDIKKNFEQQTPRMHISFTFWDAMNFYRQFRWRFSKVFYDHCGHIDDQTVITFYRFLICTTRLGMHGMVST